MNDATPFLRILTKIKTPLTLGGVMVAALYGIYKTVLSMNIFDKVGGESTYRLIESVLSKMFWLALIAIFLGVGSFVILSLRSKENRPGGARKSNVSRNAFLVGCGIGNKLMLMPVPIEGGGDRAQGLAEFFQTLTRLGIGEAQAVKDLRSVTKELAKLRRDAPTELGRDLTLKYFDAMHSINDLLRDHLSGNDRKLFEIGLLIYSIATLAAMEEGPESLRTSIGALDYQVESAELPMPLRKRCKAFVTSARSSKSPDLLSKANEVAQEAYLML